MPIALGWSPRVRLAAALMVLASPACGFPGVAFDSSDASDSSVGEPDATAPLSEAEAQDTGSTPGDTAVDLDGRTAIDAANGDADASDGGLAADARADAGDAALGVDAPARDASDAGPADVVVADARDAALADAGNDGAIDAGVNCDCGAGAMYPTHVTCSGILNVTILTCNYAAGFSDNGPPCGQSSNTFVTCPSGVQLVCAGVQSTVVQRCVQ